MKFKDFPLSKVGLSVQLVGGIWAGNGYAYLMYFPADEAEGNSDVIEPTEDEWKALLRQSDIVEIAVLEEREDGKIYKAIIRKCERNIDQSVSWHVFRRDGYACRYCGRNDVPLTVDHLVLWEEGGPTSVDNLVAACKKCNKKRGNMQLGDWLVDGYYKRVSENLSEETDRSNHALLDRLPNIPLRIRKSKKR